MIERNVHQVVLPPGTDQATIEHVIEKVEPLQARLPMLLRIKAVIGRLLHPIGVHYWVVWHSYDAASDRLVDAGLTCRYCPEGRLQ